MKKIIVLSGLVFFLAQISSAQGEAGGKMYEKIESFRVAFLTEKLALTSEEAQKFWPVFNQYRDARKKIKDSDGSKKRVEDMTDAEAEQFIGNTLDIEQRELTLKRDTYLKLKSVLPLRKVAMLQGVERDFKEEILRKAKEMRQQRRDNRRGED